jgi:HEPN domain-containing protein
MFDRSEYRRWRREADDALKGARLQAEGGLHNWACFLAEQSAQLAVKKLLHGVGVWQALADVAVVLEYVNERWLALTSDGDASEPGPGAGA